MKTKFLPRNIKQDTRPAIGFYAPGEYICRCMTCSAQFIGDKRALQCADCAYSAAAGKPLKSCGVCGAMIGANDTSCEACGSTDFET